MNLLFKMASLSIPSIPDVNVSFNVGMLMDIPTGEFVKGKHNESILNGGAYGATGVVGIGNNFKSTIADAIAIMIAGRYEDTFIQTYDTEMNTLKNRKDSLSRELIGVELVAQNRWLITDKAEMFGNVWFEKIKEVLESKIKNENIKQLTKNTPFLDRDKKPITILTPSVVAIDSLTKFDTQYSYTMQDTNELGESGANTLYMKEGQEKKRLLNMIPRLFRQTGSPFILTAHIGKDIPMDPRAAPIKKLQYLKNGDVIKGTTGDFTFLTTNCFQSSNATPLINDTTKAAEYPLNSETNQMKGDNDLFIVTLSQLRSKMGPTGGMLQLIVSQRQGVRPSLSEFHYIKSCDRFGLGGNIQNYYLEILPDVKLSRTVVRNKIDNDQNLRRALNITAEICQMKYGWFDMFDKYNLPKDLNMNMNFIYEKIKEKGYDWNVLLDTRGYWVFEGTNDKPFLSSMDILRMCLPKEHPECYHPYWLADDKKTIIGN